MEKLKKRGWARIVTWVLCILCMCFLLADPLENSQNLPQILFVSAVCTVACFVVVYRTASFEKKDVYTECVKWLFFALMAILYSLWR